MNLFYQPLLPKGVLHLDAEESRHCVKVLRRKAGDEIVITDGQGYFYKAQIATPHFQQCTFDVVERYAGTPSSHYIHIAVSPTKNTDRIEWFVEKAVEIGVNEITLVECDHTERTFIKTERLMKVAVSAMKQSLKASLPVINPVTPLTDLLTNPANTNRFIAYVDNTNPLHLKDVVLEKQSSLVLIGPEGDFSEEELATAVRNGFVKVSLGKSRLRTETAALTACFILNLRNES